MALALTRKQILTDAQRRAVLDASAIAGKCGWVGGLVGVRALVCFFVCTHELDAALRPVST